MILTVTLNPTIDQTIEVESLVAGAATCLSPGTSFCRAGDTRRLEERAAVQPLREPATV